MQGGIKLATFQLTEKTKTTNPPQPPLIFYHDYFEIILNTHQLWKKNFAQNKLRWTIDQNRLKRLNKKNMAPWM